MSTNFYAVEDESKGHWGGVFLGKRAGGWVFQFKWHALHGCSCGCERGEHVYRNIDELVEYVSRDDVTIKSEYGETINDEVFLDMTMESYDSNNREPYGKNVWEIDGHFFIKGAWS